MIGGYFRHMKRSQICASAAAIIYKAGADIVRITRAFEPGVLSPRTGASGRLATPHGTIETPVFMPKALCAA